MSEGVPRSHCDVRRVHRHLRDGVDDQRRGSRTDEMDDGALGVSSVTTTTVVGESDGFGLEGRVVASRRDMSDASCGSGSNLAALMPGQEGTTVGWPDHFQMKIGCWDCDLGQGQCIDLRRREGLQSMRGGGRLRHARKL